MVRQNELVLKIFTKTFCVGPLYIFELGSGIQSALSIIKHELHAIQQFVNVDLLVLRLEIKTGQRRFFELETR
jgi:hypothetical protein